MVARVCANLNSLGDLQMNKRLFVAVLAIAASLLLLAACTTTASGVTDAGERRRNIDEGVLAVFDESPDAIDVRASGDTSFVFGSAIKHPHPLVLGSYSVHTSAEALARGEAEIERIGAQLRAAGRL